MFGSLNPAQYDVISASAVVKKAQGNLTGVICSASSSGTIAIYDSATAAASGGAIEPILATCPLVAGQAYPIPVKFFQGLYVVIGGTATITVFYD